MPSGCAAVFSRNKAKYDIDEIFRFAKKILEVDDYSLRLARGFKGYNPEFNMKHLAKHYKDIYGTSLIRLEPGFLRGIINKIILYRNFLDIKYRYNEPEYMKCHSGKLRFVMDLYGNVYPCELKGYPYSEEKGFSWFIGNIRDFEYSFETLLKSKKAFQIREHIIKSKCVCNHGCDMNNNIIHNMDQIIKALIFSMDKDLVVYENGYWELNQGYEEFSEGLENISDEVIENNGMHLYKIKPEVLRMFVK